MALPLQARRIGRGSPQGKGAGMLEWKARILTLLITINVVIQQLDLANNWNW
jgi:hypothetical protein